MDDQSPVPSVTDQTSSSPPVSPEISGTVVSPEPMVEPESASVTSATPAPPPPTVSSVPASPESVIKIPGETASQVQGRIIQSEQVKEVKRVRRTYKLENAVGVLFGTIEGSLALRLVFKLLGARATNVFVSILYQFTGIFAGPFIGSFGQNPVFGTFELDVASIIAMIIYALVGFGA